jgi:uncharacterized protein (TIGR03437 family)
MSEITVEIPTGQVCALSVNELERNETCANTFPHNDPPMLVLNVRANGVTGPDMPVQIGGVAHFLDSCDSIFGPQSSGTCHPLVTHADGSLVSDDSPAKVGERITIYTLLKSNAATGYAPTAPAGGAPGGSFAPAPYGNSVAFSYLESGSAPTSLPGTSTIQQTVVWADWVSTVPGYVGLGQINVTVPPRPNGNYRCGGYTYPNQAGNAQITVLGVPANTVNICIQP